MRSDHYCPLVSDRSPHSIAALIIIIHCLSYHIYIHTYCTYIYLGLAGIGKIVGVHTYILSNTPMKDSKNIISSYIDSSIHTYIHTYITVHNHFKYGVNSPVISSAPTAAALIRAND